MEPRDPETDRSPPLDREAFRALLADEIPRVRGLLFRLGASADDLDDLTQETFLTVIRRLDAFRHESKPSTFLLGIAVNVLRGWRRRRPDPVPSPDSDLVPDLDVGAGGGGAPDEEALAREAAERLRRALERLSAPLREAFVLRHVEERPAVEVAAILGVPEGTVRRRAHEARERLRAWLSPSAAVPREDAP